MSAVAPAEHPPGAGDPSDGSGTGAPWTSSWPAALAAFGVICAVMWIVQWVSFTYWGVKPTGGPLPDFAGSSFLDGLVRFDGGWYVGIARDGYSYTPGAQSNVAFFPAYPLGIRAVTTVVRDHALAGILLTTAAGAGATVALWSWLGRVGLDLRQRRTALLAQLLYPYGIFLYGVVYGDALFLLVTVGVFLLAERGRWWWAGVLAIAATAGRPTGFVVALGLLVLALERGGTLRPPSGTGLLARFKVPVRVRLDRLRAWQVVPAGIALLGVAAYSFYLWSRWGDPKLFSTVQEAWGQPSGPRTWFKHYYLQYLTDSDYGLMLRRPQTGLILGTRTAQGLILLAVLLSTPFVGRRFGWGYATFVGLTAAVPFVFTADFQGGGRYMLSVFPVFALLGIRLAARPGLARGWLAVSALAAVAMMAFYSHGVYLT